MIDDNMDSSTCNTEDSSVVEESQFNDVSCKEEASSCNVNDSSREEASSCNLDDSSCKEVASSCNLDQQMMIELIKHHPIIWDTKSKEYNMTAKRVNAWKYVSAQLGIDENICRSKWKNIRDSYKKCINRREIAIRSGSRRKKPPFCRFFKELEFLHDVVSLKDSVYNITSTSTSSTNDDNKSTQTKTYIVCSDPGEEFDTQPIPINLETHRILQEEKLQRNNSDGEQEHVCTQARDYTKSHKSESELFCASLVGTLERLDQRKRQLAKIKIQQVLFELEFSDPENLSS